MLNNYELSFQKGSILTGSLLERMFAFPRDLVQYGFLDLSEGIISGLQLYHQDDKLFISKGLYHYGGKLYLLEKDEEICPEDRVFQSGTKYCTFFQESSADMEQNIHVRSLALKTMKMQDVPLQNEKLISFYGKPQLPQFCADILSENFDMLSLKQAVNGTMPTFSSYLFRLIYLLILDMRDKKALHPLDYIFLNEISSKGFIPIAMMQIYIEEAGLQIPDNTDRRDVLRLFLDAIPKLQGNGQTFKAFSEPNSFNSDSPVWF